MNSGAPFEAKTQSETPDVEADQAQMILKTINDIKFDLSLIVKFNKNDYKKTKNCRDCLRPVLKALEEDELGDLDFRWASHFKYSIFWDQIQCEIVPILSVLKKLVQTDVRNRSLRVVLARKLVNLKVYLRILDPKELPRELLSANAATIEGKGRLESNKRKQLEVYNTVDDGALQTQEYQDSLYRGDTLHRDKQQEHLSDEK